VNSFLKAGKLNASVTLRGDLLAFNIKFIRMIAVTNCLNVTSPKLPEKSC